MLVFWAVDHSIMDQYYFEPLVIVFLQSHHKNIHSLLCIHLLLLFYYFHFIFVFLLLLLFLWFL